MSESNAEQAQYWNQQAGPSWVQGQEQLDAQVRPYGLAAMQALAPQAGEVLLDVGCGCGETSLQLARSVGAEGRVLGIDISAPMLERARQRARGRANIDFLLTDAQDHPFEPGFAVGAFSRFGVMFFSDPTAAFANLRLALAPGGRIAFVCWQQREQNDWLTVPLAALEGEIPLPPPPEPGAPGPFSLGAASRLSAALQGAGFVDLELNALLRNWGGPLEDSIDFTMQVGPVAAALRAAQVGEAKRARIRERLLRTLSPYCDEAGNLALPSAAWVATARTC